MDKLTYPNSFPNKKEENFLKLILSNDKDFPKLWKIWKESNVFNDIDYAIMRLMPLVYLRLEKLNIKDELYGKIKGIYRSAWVKNQIILAGAKEVATLCEKHKIPILFLKGIPLLTDVYKNMGARFLGDADVLVPPEHGKYIVDLLLQNGWHHTKPWAAEKNNPALSIFKVIKSTELKNKNDLEMDVHFNIFAYNHQSKLMDVLMLRDLPSLGFRNSYWQHTIPTEMNNVKATRLSNEDMLIHIIVHGAEGNTHRALRWVVDAATLINTLPIDWEILLRNTEQFNFKIELYLGFKYLNENIGVKIPPAFLKRLKELPTNKKTIEKYYKIANISHHERMQLLGNIPLLWYAYFKFEPNVSFPRNILGFMKYARTSWGLENNSQIFKFVFNQYKRKLQIKNPNIFNDLRQTIQNSLYIIGSKGISFLASFVTITILGRYVTREVVGSYNYIIATLSVISITTLPGMEDAFVRTIAKGNDGNVWPMMKKRLMYGILGSILSLIIGAISWIQGNHQIGLAFLVASPFVPLTDTFSNFAIYFWQGKKRFDRSAITLMSYYLGLAIFSIPIFILTNNLIIIILSIMIIQTAMGLLVYSRIKKNNDTRDTGAIKLGMHLTVMQTLNLIAKNIDRIIVWYLLGPIMVAIYSFAMIPVSKAYQMIPIGTITLPYLSRHELTKELKKSILKKTFLLFIITIPATLLIIYFAPVLYKIFFPKYPESIYYFQILMLGLAFSPALLLKATLTAFHQTKALYIGEISTPILKIILMITLAITFGLTGLALGIVISTIFNFIITLMMFLKIPTTTNQIQDL